MNIDHTLVASATNGLELEWMFTNNTLDTSGKGRHGTAFNAVSTSDREGNSDCAYFFNGTNAYIQGPIFAACYSNGFSISLWIKVFIDPQWVYYIVRSSDFSLQQYQYTDVYFGIKPVLANCWCIVPADTWTHIAATYDGNNMRIYRDGNLQMTSPRSGSVDYSASQNFEIGRASNWYWPGYVDDVRVYSYTLSPDDVAKLAAE